MIVGCFSHADLLVTGFWHDVILTVKNPEALNLVAKRLMSSF
jgi:hypothetical protein